MLTPTTPPAPHALAHAFSARNLDDTSVLGENLEPHTPDKPSPTLHAPSHVQDASTPTTTPHVQRHVQILSSTHGEFDMRVCGRDFQGIKPLLGSDEEAAARRETCTLLLSGAAVAGSPTGANKLRTWCMENYELAWKGKPGLCAADPLGPERVETNCGVVVMTWAHPGEDGNVYSLEQLRGAEPIRAHHPSAGYLMDRPASGGTVAKVISFTPAIALIADLLLDNPHSSLIVDGQFMHDRAEKEVTSDGSLKEPSDHFAEECYETVFDHLLRSGSRAYLIVEGAIGRTHLLAYIKKNNGRAAPYSQSTLDELGIDLDYATDLHVTGGGAIFELFIHGHVVYVFCRPSTGSYVHSLFREVGRHSAACALKQIHNQMVLLGKLMGKAVPPFRSNASPLSQIYDSESAQTLTDRLRAKGWLPPLAMYRTPLQNGAHASNATDPGEPKGIHKRADGSKTMSSSDRAHASKAVQAAKSAPRNAILMKQYEHDPYPTAEVKQQLATRLDMTYAQVFDWFHRRRRLESKKRNAALTGSHAPEEKRHRACPA